MADKKIQMKLRNAENTAWDNLYPIPDLTDYIRQPGFGTTAGSANTYTVATTPAPTALVDGMSIYLKINVTNTGASTLDWDSLGVTAILDAKGNALTAGKLTAGSVIGVRYNDTTGNFILLGEGGEYGTAEAAQVLTPYTIGTEDGIVAGTMPDQGAKIITPTTINQAIPAGYHNGNGIVYGDTNLTPPNIAKGVSVFGVAGSLDTQSIKSIQRIDSIGINSSNLTNTKTIAEVNPEKSIILQDWMEVLKDNSGINASSHFIVTFNSPTEILLSRVARPSGSYSTASARQITIIEFTDNVEVFSGVAEVNVYDTFNYVDVAVLDEDINNPTFKNSLWLSYAYTFPYDSTNVYLYCCSSPVFASGFGTRIQYRASHRINNVKIQWSAVKLK